MNIILHATRAGSVHEASSPISPIDEEKGHALGGHTAIPNFPVLDSPLFDDPEKDDCQHTRTSHRQVEHAWSSTSSVNILHGRPDVDGIIKRIVAETPDEDRVIIAACGPDALMWSVRKTAASCIEVNGPSVELHCEQFGW